MPKNKPKTLTEHNSIDELVDYFDTHDLGDEWEQMPEAKFEINIQSRKHLIALEEDVATQVTRIAKAKRVSSETLINTWLKDRLQKVG
jgi:CopG antitoxin of type II toxin-antitoxin system